MRTDRVRVVLRPRGALEAIDLGFAMARAWWRPLAVTWLVLALPLAVVPILVLREHPFWALLLLWVLRPLLARIPLHVLGSALFGEPVGLRETARALPRLLRAGAFTSLVTQRLSPARTFLLPVLVLEGLRGRPRRARCAALSGSDIGAAMGLMGVGAHLNACLILGLLMALSLLVPSEVEWDAFELFAPLFDDEANAALLVVVPSLYLAGTSVIEPLLVAGGFGLYLNRRVHLEGWDIDLAFRRLSRRVGGTTVLALATGLFLQTPAPAWAEGVCRPDHPSSATACADEVLAGEDFARTREITFWKLKRDLFDSDDVGEGWDLSWLGGGIAALSEVLLWILVAVAGIAVVSALIGARGRGARVVEPPPLPVSLFGLDLDPENLPDDVVGAARDARHRGHAAEALSLLYRGALVFLVERGGLSIPESATERECVGLVRESARAGLAPALQHLTEAWLQTRYAALPLDDDTFDVLCRSFSRSFGGADEAGAVA